MGCKTQIIKHTDKILFISKNTLMIMALIFASKDSPKASKAIDQKEHERALQYQQQHPEDPNLLGYRGLTKMEKFKTAAPCYWRTALFAGGAIGLDVYSSIRTNRMIDSYKWIAASAIEEKTKTLTAIEENVSKDKLNKIKSQIAQENIDKCPPTVDSSFHDDGSHLYRIFDCDVRSTRNEVDAKFNKINSRINQGETFTIADLKPMFGITPSKGDNLIGFGESLSGIPGNIIRYEVIPASDSYGNPIGKVWIKTDPVSVYDSVYHH